MVLSYKIGCFPIISYCIPPSSGQSGLRLSAPGAWIAPAKRPPGHFCRFLGCTGGRQTGRDGCVRLRRRQIRRRPVRPGCAWTRGWGGGPTRASAPSQPLEARREVAADAVERGGAADGGGREGGARGGGRAATKVGERTAPTRARGPPPMGSRGRGGAPAGIPAATLLHSASAPSIDRRSSGRGRAAPQIDTRRRSGHGHGRPRTACSAGTSMGHVAGRRW
jgi:hypothetical protein